MTVPDRFGPPDPAGRVPSFSPPDPAARVDSPPGSDTVGPATEVASDDRIGPRHLHPLSPLLASMTGALRAWPILLVAFARSLLWLVLVLAVALVLWRLLVWSRTTYAVTSDGLVVRSGIVWRNVHTVPPQRVQQVEIRRSLRHRAVGVSTVEVGLAGGGESGQVELDALSERDAEQLATILERWRVRHRSASTPRATDPSAPPAPSGPPLLTLSTVQLVIAGLTSRSLWLAPLAAIAALAQVVFDDRLGDDAGDAVRTRLSETSPAVLLAVVMVVALLVASVGTVVRHHGLTVTEADDDLVVRRGLLEERVMVIPRPRVQVVEVSSHVIRDRLEMSALEIRTANLSGSSGSSESSTAVPIGPNPAVDGLVQALLPRVELPGDLARHPPAAVRRSIVQRSLRLVPLAALAGLLVFGPEAAAWFALGGLVVAVPSGWVAGRRLRTGWTDTAVVTRRGAVAWRRWVVPVERLQSAAVVSTPFQRRLGLATVRLDVAGVADGVEVRDVATADAERIAALVFAPAVEGAAPPAAPLTAASPSLT